MGRDELLRGLRRFGAIAGTSVVGTALVSLVVGIAAGQSARRSLTLGFYLVGALCVIVGFLHFGRPPVRTSDDESTTLRPFGLFGARGGAARWATPDERSEQLGASAVFVVLGLLLIVLGVLSDNRYPLT